MVDSVEARLTSFSKGKLAMDDKDIEEAMKICDKVFGGWEWASNANFSPSGCRIMIGWDQNYVRVMVIHSSNQSMFCLIEDVSTTFKVTLKSDEHSEGMSCSSADMIEFQECIERLEMEDINKTGCHFTWTKSLKNLKTAIMKKLDRIMSNGAFISKFTQAQECFLPFLVSDHSPAVIIIPKSLKKKNRAFRFSNYLSDKKEFIPAVKKGWDKRIKGFKMVVALKEELKLIQIKSIENVHDVDIRKRVADKLRMKHKSFIGSICDENGIRYSGYEVPKQFVTHFMNFLGVNRETESITNAQELFTQKVINNKDKFFKAAWEVIGSHVYEAIKEFFQNGKLLGEVNATIISLVPKIKTPAKVSDFRPIACCNVVYKIISKVLTNRMKNMLCRIVSKNQSAFIPGRSITNNILLTQELLKGYGCKQGKQRCAFKIDIINAYDTVSWKFLEKILEGFGFLRKFIRWVMTCVSTTVFSICVNGESHGYFKGGRGLRQGDPISPYHIGCEEQKITNLRFADDLLILWDRDRESVKVIKLALEKFSAVYGLVPNLKSKIPDDWIMQNSSLKLLKPKLVKNCADKGKRSWCKCRIALHLESGYYSMLDDAKLDRPLINVGAG
ncbi:RNA-directed DNA polymerase, eukaryota, reverse transcriptase zinc-binding domain protein [Tanacetum coccineum]